MGTLYGVGRKYKQFVPRKSSLHRQAAIALYRALISQCRASPFSPTDRDELQNIVRNRFIAHRDEVSLRLLKLSFHAGYKALDHLDASVAGDNDATTHILTYLSQIPLRLKSPPPPPPPARESPRGIEEPPPEHKFLANFPRESVEGIRKAPFYSNATGLPFVRWKKPQPESLSRTLRQLLAQKQARWDYVYTLEAHYIPLAEMEDQWEDILQKTLNVGDAEAWNYVEPMKEALKEVHHALRGRDDKSAALAKTMFGVVEREKELALQERDERRRIAWEKRQAKKKGTVAEEKDALSELENAMKV